MLEDQLHHFFSRGFADQDEHVRGRVLLERFERLQHHDPADFFFQVAAARSNALGDAHAVAGQQGADFLQAGAGGGDNAHRPGREHVRKTEGNIVEDAGPGSGTHQQQTMVTGIFLQRNFIFQGDVIAEQKHVQAVQQGLPGFVRGITASHRDDRHVRSRIAGKARRGWFWA